MTAPQQAARPAAARMDARTWGAIVLIVLSAAGTTLQARLNGELLGYLHNAPEVSLLNLGFGLLTLLVVLAFSSSMREGVRRTLDALRTGDLRWWQLTGGLAGAFFVSTQAITVPVIGVAVFTVAVVAGQSANSVTVDMWGLGPAGRQAVTPARLVAAGLAVLAVIVAVSGRWSLAGDHLGAVVAMTALALAAGVIGVLQGAFNGQVARAAGQALNGALVNFLFGTLALGLVVGALWGLTDIDPVLPSLDHWWLLLSGVLGLAYVATMAGTVRRLGILRSGLASVAGLLAGALLLDLVAPTPGGGLTIGVILGVVLAFAAVAISLVRR